MLVAVWLCASLGIDTEDPRPTQAYAHVLMAEWLLAHGDREGAAEELRYALVFDHDNATIKARLASIAPTQIAKVTRASKRTGWLSKQMRKRTPDVRLEDKTSRRVAESKAD